MTSTPIDGSDPGRRPPDVIVAVDLRRTYRKREGWFRSPEVVEAVKGISFSVPRGTVFGMLGPNGAGKTTTIKMLSTLLIPTSGTATVDGFDVVRNEVDVRRRLGVLFGGDKGLYNQLSAKENLRYFGRLYGMADDTIARRSAELFEQVGLTDRANERVESYSRGMKQRLHIAKTLVHRPPVVILDEPTIGLDPAAALGVRALIADLIPHHTVLLTTHDMHEADVLCSRLAIVDKGVIVAEGTPEELKAGAPMARQVVIRLSAPLEEGRAQLVLHLADLPSVAQVTDDPGSDDTLVLRCTDTTATLDQSLALLRQIGAGVRAIDVREPSLEDAFLGATGREFDDSHAEELEEAS
ncbi:MAG: ABC transporter ATP-binding protein [Actinomycetota bacterium]|nr:ABC transporter ATP-binding protein [Actinomycetota bacterium]